MPGKIQRFALLICAAYLLLALAYAAATPLFEAPDEGAHFLYSHNLLKTGQLPVIGGREATFASKDVQRHHPPLYYALGALLIAPTRRADVDDYFLDNPFGSVGFVSVNNNNIYLHNPPMMGDTRIAAWIMRGYSLALAAGTLWLIFLAGQIAVPGQSAGILALLAAAAIPGFIAGGGSINNDNLVTFLFAAGIYHSLRMWRRGAITRVDVVLASLILPASALSKLTGLALFPLVYGALLLGALRGRYPLKAAARLVIVSLLAWLLLAGWWYIRNWTLYGDPFALAATRAIWSRGFELSVTPAQIYLEAKGIWESFWMVLGHLSIRGPDWLYPYVTALTLFGALGLVPALWRAHDRDGALLLLGVTGLVTLALIMATRQVNISQGRLLYPALIGFAPLLALGWKALLRRFAPLVFVPLIAVAFLTPPLYLARAFAPAEIAPTLPNTIRRVDASAESLTLLGYQLKGERAVQPGAVVELDLYFRGNHPENPSFFVTALDPATGATFGNVDLYPGMAATRWLDPAVIYRAPVRFMLDSAQGQPPLRLALAVGWRTQNGDDWRYLDWVDANGTPLALLALDGWTLIDPTYTPPAPEHAAAVTFGGAIRLEGYTLPARVAPGAELPITLVWRGLQPMTADYTLTVGMIDSDGDLLAQADAQPQHYPTSAWQPGAAFEDRRALTIPADAPPGIYRVYVGWYRTPDLMRLPAQGEDVADDLYWLPVSVEVVPPRAIATP